jgi:hypothetical protein
MEAEMRALIFAMVGGLALATSAQAAPVSPKTAGIEFGAAPPIELMRDGCARTPEEGCALQASRKHLDPRGPKEPIASA